MKWFTSDWHLGEDRIGINGKPNLFYRPFSSTEEQNLKILEQFLSSGFKDGDELFHLGDVVYDWKNGDYVNASYVLRRLRKEYPNSKFFLIAGNYDIDKLDKLKQYFDYIWENGGITHLHDNQFGYDYVKVYMNHYPISCKHNIIEYAEMMTNTGTAYGNHPISFALTGHIHGLWKVQEKMINVGVDAWHFKPVSEEEIMFCWNAMHRFYDENVFPYKITL